MAQQHRLKKGRCQRIVIRRLRQLARSLGALGISRDLANRVKVIDLKYEGSCELPALGAVSVPIDAIIQGFCRPYMTKLGIRATMLRPESATAVPSARTACEFPFLRKPL